MSVSPFMNLQLPTVSVTLGPEWAVEINEALEAVDAHTHTSGSGVQIPTAGLNINAHLDFQGYKAYDLFSTQFDPVNVPLTGASNANSVSVSAGNLYFTNGSGISVQITSGGSVVSTPAQVENLQYDTVASNLTIGASDNYVFLAVDTTSSRTITLPLASSVATGRIYYIKDATGDSNTNPITVDASGSDLIDGAADVDLYSNYSCTGFISNGVDAWASF